MKWYLFKKTFRNGSRETFCLCSDDDDAERKAKAWAESSGGGHVYGYRCTLRLKKPTRKTANEFITKKIKEAMNLTAKISEINKEIAEAEDFVRKETKLKEGKKRRKR